MPCDTVANWHRPHAFTNPWNDLGFRLPDNFPSARSLLLIATSSAHDHQPRFADHPPRFRCHPNYPFHGLTRPCSWRSAGPSSRIPVTAWTGSITIFHETGSRSERTGAIRPQQHLLC